MDLPGRPPDAQLIGYAALIDHYGLECASPRRLTAITAIGQRFTERRDGVDWLLLPRSASYRIPGRPIEHLGIALKHEGVDLRVLDRLFRKDIADELAAFVETSRSGLYTRRAWFLYEWMTGRRLPLDDLGPMQYIPALDPNTYIGLRRGERSMRHKVENNLPGVAGFCPLIRRTERLAPDRISGLAEEAQTAVSSADPAVLRRAVSFMLLNESKGSFSIEGERPSRNRLERWGRLIAEAKHIDLSIPSMEALHRLLFEPGDQRFVTYGVRTKAGFVGLHDRDQTPVPDHICARPEDLPGLLTDMFTAFGVMKTGGYDPILSAALLGFGFVFIHPFADGNGRLHRFLLQKALVDLGFNPPGVVLPVSAAILEDLQGYRSALEDYSAPTLDAIEWEPTEDGNVNVLNETGYLYRHFDATRQAEYLVDRVERTIHYSLPAELEYLGRFDDAKRRLAQVIDLPDRLASLFIQFCAQNGGSLSARKREDYFEVLTEQELSRMQAAVQASRIADLGAPTGTTG